MSSLISKDEILSPAVKARLEEIVRDLGTKLPKKARLSCSLRRVAKGFYEAFLSVELGRGKVPILVARKSNESIYRAMSDCTRAILRQMNRRNRFQHRGGCRKGELFSPTG